jgi:hypothetical protein
MIEAGGYTTPFSEAKVVSTVYWEFTSTETGFPCVWLFPIDRVLVESALCVTVGIAKARTVITAPMQAKFLISG